MRKPLEMITNLRMQNIMEIRKKNNLLRDQITFWKKIKSYFGALGLKSPHGGAIMSEATQKGSWLVVDQCAQRLCNAVPCHGPTVAPKNNSPKGSQK